MTADIWHNSIFAHFNPTIFLSFQNFYLYKLTLILLNL